MYYWCSRYWKYIDIPAHDSITPVNNIQRSQLSITKWNSDIIRLQQQRTSCRNWKTSCLWHLSKHCLCTVVLFSERWKVVILICVSSEIIELNRYNTFLFSSYSRYLSSTVIEQSPRSLELCFKNPFCILSRTIKRNEMIIFNIRMFK